MVKRLFLLAMKMPDAPGRAGDLTVFVASMVMERNSIPNRGFCFYELLAAMQIAQRNNAVGRYQGLLILPPTRGILVDPGTILIL